ncbi:uncharacterized protein LOC126734253 isoform X2 [Anthonomus grandis grandis]|uniref:uncharacterized protein LOC126734253 isoform X2 n=1 Tax=Anthonomus grandis grandis TaxID=2921223 RepID=UPI00216519EC|nr:uncharacterized protein LOC126734253 isoform X2 [Anthonomus grandis grandis]
MLSQEIDSFSGNQECPLLLFGDFNLPKAIWSSDNFCSQATSALGACPLEVESIEVISDLCSFHNLYQLNNIPNHLGNTLDLIFCESTLSAEVTAADDALVPQDNYHPPLLTSITVSRGHTNHPAKLDRKESAIEDCTKAIELNSTYVRAYLRRAKLYEDSDKLDESLEDFKKLLELDPGNKDALAATVRLPPKINEKNEKLKEEMMGKLKDLGNVILRPFGLSTDNFKLTQDPNTGGYSVNFSQNK